MKEEMPVKSVLLSLLSIGLLLATLSAAAQVTTTVGVSNVDCVGNPLTINEVRVNWTSASATDSMVWISHGWPCGGSCGDPGLDYDRQVYDATKVTNHCMTLNYIEPSYASNNQMAYDVQAGGCTTSSGGVPCLRTDPNLSVAGTTFFNAAVPAAGTFTFTPVFIGPKSVYRQTGMNLPINVIWTGGTYTQGTQFLTVTSATVDGQSCLPGTKLGSACGTTGITLQGVCTGGAEVLDTTTNNYSTHLYSSSGSIHTYDGDYTCYNHYVGEPALLMRLVPSASATTGSHTISTTITLLDNSGHVISSSSPISWTFTVKATPAFTIVSSGYSLPLPNYGLYVATAATWGTYACGVLTAGNNAGVFLNQNMSPDNTHVDPYAVFNYDGNRIFKQLKDFFGSALGTWASGHSYNLGDWVVSGGYTQVVTTAGTSGATTPPFSGTPGNTTADGTGTGAVTWTNAGNANYWRDCSSRVGMQYLDWAYNVANFSTTSEWNVFPWGMYMDYLRQNDTLSENCNGSGSCMGLNQAANERLGANILTTGFPSFQAFAQSYASPSNDTVRNLPYSLNVALVDWLENGTLNDPGLNEVKARVDLLLQTIDDIVTYNPLDGSAKSTYACCYSAPNFDIGLLATSLIDYFAVNYLQNSGAVDGRVPVELLRLADWYNSYQFNLTGTDYSSTYQPWVPYTGTDSVQSLGTLNLPLWSWLGMVYGVSCALPTSGQGCWAAHDLMFQHALDHFHYYEAKQINQVLEFFPNYTGWRRGMPGTDSYILPSHNSFEGSYPDILGPFNATSYTTLPSPVVTPTSSGATIVWYTYEKAVSTKVQVGTTSINPPSSFTCAASTYSGLNNLWQNTCTVSGLASHTTYYFSVGGTDAASNSVQSSFAPGNLVYKGIDTGVALASRYTFTTL
jgi:hypothetical protein